MLEYCSPVWVINKVKGVKESRLPTAKVNIMDRWRADIQNQKEL